MTGAALSWIGILRLGVVQSALGAVVVLTTSTLNRVMVVELALPAMLPGALVALHYILQVLRPRWGYGSDVGGRRTPWIVGGMAVLALGGILAALATALMKAEAVAGLCLAVLAFALIGGGVGAAGTSLLVLLAKSVAPSRRAAAATTVWLMMIAGMAITATAAGAILDPFSLARLIAVACLVAGLAFSISLLAVWGIEGKAAEECAIRNSAHGEAKPAFREALRQVWSETQARRFSLFIFVSMLAYSGQDLILEPFAGSVFGLTPGQSTGLSGTHHGGVLLGMILVAVAGSGRGLGSMRAWAVAGCLGSAAALGAIALGGFRVQGFPLTPAVLALGFANGVFAVAAIASMMAMVAKGRKAREGTRMGLWGAAQALAFGLGGFAGTVAIDIARGLLDSPAQAYAVVFGAEALLFLVSGYLAMSLGARETRSPTPELRLAAET